MDSAIAPSDCVRGRVAWAMSVFGAAGSCSTFGAGVFAISVFSSLARFGADASGATGSVGALAGTAETDDGGVSPFGSVASGFGAAGCSGRDFFPEMINGGTLAG